eukprot:CAMPEP_0174746248 /NCGR_PEP_ID=MMETSP1094-20130205/88647_1 /TAXON_ID=156173 /ORGANISM="Chrysochromulina brevifilum, Strain UTEX LB 985" /LENGTH=235 /DNA_ID=CAMNT_0015950923 /DNA_START=1 /DNA_END=705 /DNA_ORIENTATION=+
MQHEMHMQQQQLLHPLHPGAHGISQAQAAANARMAQAQRVINGHLPPAAQQQMVAMTPLVSNDWIDPVTRRPMGVPPARVRYPPPAPPPAQSIDPECPVFTFHGRAQVRCLCCIATDSSGAESPMLLDSSGSITSHAAGKKHAKRLSSFNTCSVPNDAMSPSQAADALQKRLDADKEKKARERREKAEQTQQLEAAAAAERRQQKAESKAEQKAQQQKLQEARKPPSHTRGSSEW